MDILKNTIHEVKIEGTASSGAGVARINGRAVFVPLALEGELCRIKILKTAKNAVYAKLEQIIEPSLHRTEPTCPNFGKCGGCDFLHMSYEEELRVKTVRINDAMKRIGNLELKVSEMLPAPSRFSYRNKAVYAVSRKNGKVITGFYRPRSHDTVPVERCLILNESSDRAALALRKWMERFNISAYDENAGTGQIRRLFTRRSEYTGGLMVCVSAFSGIPHTKELVETILDEAPETVSVILNINKNAGNTVLSGSFYTLCGSAYIEDRICGLLFRFSPEAFFQINHTQAELLYETAMRSANILKSETALDLYCGTGTITLIAAKHAKFVTGAETVSQAVADAKENAKQNCITNAEFICVNASEATKHLPGEGKNPNVVFLDPPRKGLSPETVKAVSEIDPERIVYISCDPATLARDLNLFRGFGYAAKELSAVDMFPGTANVECCCLLIREIL